MEEALSKGICFRLGSEQYLHPLNTVKEVLSYQESAPVPGAGDGVEGMIEVRGNMVTVLYGSYLLDLDPEECQEEGHIIVLDLPSGYFGIRVEGVEKVMDLPDSQTTQTLEYKESEFVQGTMQHDDELYILVDFSDYCKTLS